MGKAARLSDGGPDAEDGGGSGAGARATRSAFHDRQLLMSLEPSDACAEAAPPELALGMRESSGGGPNRLTASQFPSRNSSAGSMDQAVPAERGYNRVDSGASASSAVSVASFASLQHTRSASNADAIGGGDGEDLGLVQRSASVSTAPKGAAPAGFPGGQPSLKPVWQAAPAPAAAPRKTPGKSRFAA